jgi:hypothetical protein
MSLRVAYRRVLCLIAYGLFSGARRGFARMMMTPQVTSPSVRLRALAYTNQIESNCLLGPPLGPYSRPMPRALWSS